MILIDTGPLVALTDKGQGALHHKCVSVINQLPSPLITTWPCFTEAMYFVGELRGWHGQAVLWRYVKDGGLELHVPEPNEWVRISDLMEQYRDTPMDLADASLVSLAELRGLRRIITLDSDFYIYRVGGKESFDVILVTIS